MREEERALSGLLFCPADPELRALKAKAHRLSHEYNDTYEEDTGRRSEILSELVGELGENAFMQGPIQFHYGCHTRIGKNFFANFNFTVQDDGWVTIGDNCAFGPGVTLVTPVHPMLPDERRLMLDGEGNKRRLCYAKSVTVGNRLLARRECHRLLRRRNRRRLCHRCGLRRDGNDPAAYIRRRRALPSDKDTDGEGQHEV